METSRESFSGVKMMITDEQLADIRRSAEFDLARVGMPGSPVRERAAWTVTLVDAYRRLRDEGCKILAERDVLRASRDMLRATVDRIAKMPCESERDGDRTCYERGCAECASCVACGSLAALL